MHQRITSIVTTLGLLFSTVLHAEVTEGAKSIFDSGYGPQIAVSAEPAQALATVPKRSAPRRTVNRTSREKYIGVSYWVELTGSDNRTQRVTSAQTFHSGDRIKLKLKSNTRGYLYLFNLGSTGRYSMLFPYADKSNFVQAYATYTVPQQGHIVFDENPGDEMLRIVMSSHPLPLRSEASYTVANRSRLLSVSYPCGSKDLYIDGTDQLVQMGQQCGAKDLLVEEDTSSAQPAAYAVAPLSTLDAKAEIIWLALKLRHR